MSGSTWDLKKTKILKVLNPNDLLVFLQNLSMKMKACVGNKSVLLLKTKEEKIKLYTRLPTKNENLETTQ